MVKYITFLLTCFAFNSSINAQDISDASESVKNIANVNTEKWQNVLILTVNQREKMTEYVILYEMKKNAIFRSDASMDDKNTQLKVLEEEHHLKVETILNEKQKTKYHQKIAEVKEG